MPSQKKQIRFEEQIIDKAFRQIKEEGLPIDEVLEDMRMIFFPKGLSLIEKFIFQGWLITKLEQIAGLSQVYDDELKHLLWEAYHEFDDWIVPADKSNPDEDVE